MKTRSFLATALAAVITAGLIPAVHAQPATDFVTVSGSATYLQRIALPPEAVLTVRIEDISSAGNNAQVLAETREPFGQRQTPLAYSLQVPSSAIDPKQSYSVRATITVGSELRFTTTRLYPALTQGAPNLVNVVLSDASATQAQAPAATLQNTYWKLVEVGGRPVAMLPQQQREAGIMLSGDSPRLNGFSGCNALVGTYTQDGPALKFSQIAGTLMACTPALGELENSILEMLATTTGQRIEGQQLSLLGGTQVLARFEAVYLQ